MIKQEPKYDEKELWQKFSMLTDEMTKFIEKGDIDQFLEMTRQRDQIEKMIANQTETAFIKSEEGQELLKNLIFLNKAMHVTGQKWLNGTRNNRNISRSYESLGHSMSGMRIDGKL